MGNVAAIPEWAQKAGRELAQVDEDERKRLQKLINQLAVTAAPDEEVGKPPVRTLEDYLAWEIENPPILVEPGLVARGAITATVSRGGKGKTALSLNRLVRWSCGLPMFDELPDVMRPAKPLKTLIIENEGAPGMFQDVIRKIVYKGDYDDGQRAMILQNIFIWGDGGWSGLKLDEGGDLATVDRALEVVKPDILFLEPFKGLWRGDENNSTEMDDVLDALSGLGTKHECGIMLTHHERKSGAGDDGEEMSALRGSSALEGKAAVIERWKPVKAGQQRELRWIKWRFADPAAPVRMEFSRETHGYAYIPEDRVLRDIIGIMEQAPAEWYRVAELAEDLGETEAKVRKTCNEAASGENARLKRIKDDRSNGYRFRLSSGDGNGEAEGGWSV